MSRLMKRLVIGLSCASLLTVSGTLALADSPAPTTNPVISTTTGTITGTVTGVNGGTSGVTVKLFQVPVAGATTTTTGKHHRRLVAVGTPVTTGSDGSFTIPNVPPGNYIIMATLKGVGRGHAKVDLTGTTASVSITLKNRKAKAQ
jgi:hypothetical protein